MYFSSLLTVVSEDDDISDYPDDFEEAEDDDLVEVVSYARDAMNCVSENDVELELKDAGGFSVTMKALKEKYMGKHAHFYILSRLFFFIHLIVLFFSLVSSLFFTSMMNLTNCFIFSFNSQMRFLHNYIKVAVVHVMIIIVSEHLK